MLSPLQIKTLAIEARKAWSALKPAERAEIAERASEAANDPFGVSDAKAFDFWRHEQQREVTGKASLREMDNEDFNRLKSRWLFLQGKIKGSLEADIAATEEDCRQLRFLIKQECEKYELHLNYAEAICQNKCGEKLDFAGAEILRHVLFTVRNRGRHSKRRKPTAKPKIDTNGKLPAGGFYIRDDTKPVTNISLVPPGKSEDPF